VPRSLAVRQVPFAVQVGLVAAAYFVTARLSLALAIPPGYACAVWPPSGLALAAALALGWRVWPGIWLGAGLANFMVESSFLSATLIASGNTLEVLVARALILRYVGDPGAFARGEDVVKFILVCALSAVVAATAAAVALAAAHALPWQEGFRSWWTWWQGDASGMIIATPLVLSWCAGSARPWRKERTLEAAAFALLLAATVIAISADDATGFAPFSLSFVALPFIIWASFRLGQREVTTAIAVVCAVAVWYVLERPGLFPGAALNELLLLLLTFISMVVTTGLVLTTALSRRHRDTAELRQKVARHTHFDPLTGLPNGALFRERLAQLLAVTAEGGGTVAVAVLDIDRFKIINDALGRQAGDELLRRIAERLSHEAGGGIVARLDGVLFALAAPTFEGELAAAGVAERQLARWFGAPYRVGENDLRLSARMGLALFPAHGREPDALLMRAEFALRKAKTSGERHVVYAPAMSERVAERLALENQLRHALEREEFVLHYQPKVDLDSREIVGVEALIRWKNAEGGLVPPVHFIPLLEETGLIVEVGNWVLRRAMLDQELWRAEGVRVPRVAVNVSSIQLRQRNFVELVQAALGEEEAAIDLEITESHIMEDIESTIVKLRRLRELGLGIAIDDFGTGYSSLAYLARLPVQTLKIDRAFVIRILDDEEAMALVQMIIALAQSLKLTVVAEGVESEMQADVLATLRCDQMQGFFISQPRPREEITPLLRRR
jgi:diguanylate cyclase (GGDEF)-like protein